MGRSNIGSDVRLQEVSIQVLADAGASTLHQASQRAEEKKYSWTVPAHTNFESPWRFLRHRLTEGIKGEHTCIVLVDRKAFI